MNVARSVALLGLVATVVAAEKPSAAAPAPPTEDSIASAKRDLEVINAARAGTEQPRADLPAFGAPDMQIGLAPPQRPSLRKSPAEAAASKKSANWLVDAMTKKPAHTADGKDFRPEKSLRENGTENEHEVVTRNRVEASGKVDHRQARASVEPVVNPLTNFMAGWMTPQDFKLLQPGLANESAPSLLARGEPSSGPTARGSSADLSGLTLFGRKPLHESPVPPRENPFLQEFSVPTPSGGPVVVVLPPAFVPTPASKALALSVEPPPQKTATPAFAKPNDDAKYFKPLKRF